MGEEKTKPWSFPLWFPLSTKGRGVGESQRGCARLAFPTKSPERIRRVCLNKTPDGLVPKLGRTPPSRNRGHGSGPHPGTPTSPPPVPRGENTLRLPGQGCRMLCSLRQLATISFGEGFPHDQWFSGHRVILNYTLNLTLHGRLCQAVQRPDPNDKL